MEMHSPTDADPDAWLERLSPEQKARCERLLREEEARATAYIAWNWKMQRRAMVVNAFLYLFFGWLWLPWLSLFLLGYMLLGALAGWLTVRLRLDYFFSMIVHGVPSLILSGFFILTMHFGHIAYAFSMLLMFSSWIFVFCYGCLVSIWWQHKEFDFRDFSGGSRKGDVNDVV